MDFISFWNEKVEKIRPIKEIYDKRFETFSRGINEVQEGFKLISQNHKKLEDEMREKEKQKFESNKNWLKSLIQKQPNESQKPIEFDENVQ